MADPADRSAEDYARLIGSAKFAASDFVSTIEGQEKKAAAANERRKGRDRSYISLIIIGTYSLAVIGMFAYILGTVPSCAGLPDADTCKAVVASWDRQAELLLNVIVTAVLPIVTLMLGFYFGTERAAAIAQGDQ